MPIRWSKEAIITAILELNKAGIRLNVSTVKAAHTALWGAGCKWFGSWKHAVTAAGLDYQAVLDQRVHYRKWDRKRVIEEIQVRHKNRESIRSEDIKKHGDGLYSAAKKYCGSWKEAVEAAGFEYKTHKWSHALVVVEIRARHRNGKSIRARAVSIDYRRLYKAACVLYGSWEKAVQAAGFDYDLVRFGERWSKELVLARILERHQHQLPLNSREVQRQMPSLVNAATKYLGSWEKAIEAAGLSYREIHKYAHRRRWSQKLVIAAIRQRVNDGFPINMQSVKEDDPPLLYASCHYFCSWEAGVEAAGYDYNKVIKLWRFSRRVKHLRVATT
jgi:hypothetical protein